MQVLTLPESVLQEPLLVQPVLPVSLLLQVLTLPESVLQEPLFVPALLPVFLLLQVPKPQVVEQ